MTTDTPEPPATTADTPSEVNGGMATTTSMNTATGLADSDGPGTPNAATDSTETPEPPSTTTTIPPGTTADMANTTSNVEPGTSYAATGSAASQEGAPTGDIDDILKQAKPSTAHKNRWERQLDLVIDGIKKNGGKLDARSTYLLKKCVENKKMMDVTLELEEKRKKGGLDYLDNLDKIIEATIEDETSKKDDETEFLEFMKEWHRFALINVLAYIILFLWVWTIDRYIRFSQKFECGENSTEYEGNSTEYVDYSTECDKLYYGSTLAIHNVSSFLYTQ